MNFQLNSVQPKTVFIGGVFMFLTVALFGVLGTIKDVEYNRINGKVLEEQWRLKIAEQESFSKCMQAYQQANTGAAVYSSDATRCREFVLD